MAICTMNASWTHATFYVSASASGRTGNVSVTLYLWNTGGKASWTSNSISNNFYITINGTTTYFTINRVDSATEGTTKVVKSASKSFTLNQDGSGSVSVSVGGNIPGTSFKITGNNTYSTSIKGDPVTYSVSYNANGGSGAPGTQYYYYGGSNIYLSSTIPTKSGYNFLGWSLSSTATSPSYYPGQSWSSSNGANYTLYAVWELANGKSTFVLSSNTIDLDSTLIMYVTAVNSSNTHKMEITINGTTVILSSGRPSGSTAWIIDAVNWSKYLTGKTANGIITLTTYSGSTNLGSVSQSVTLVLPESIGKPDKPTAVLSSERFADAIINLKKPIFKYGATFKEWQVESNIGKAKIIGNRVHVGVNPSINKTVATTIRAIDSRGFISDPVSIQWHKRKQDASIFINGKWISYIPYVYTNNTWVESKAILYNELEIYDIIYNLNGGILPDDAQKEYYKYKGLSSLPTPTKDGYDFIGWYKFSDFSGKTVTSIPVNSTGDKTLYAKWVMEGSIPEGATYTLKSDGTVLTAGMPFPDTVTTGDIYKYGDYEYRYNENCGSGSWSENISQNGWGVRVLNNIKTEYGIILSSINNAPVVSLAGTFAVCGSMITAPIIPNSIIDMTYTFIKCYNLTGNIEINSNPTSYANCFVETHMPIKITGSTTLKAELAAQANNDNVTYEISFTINSISYQAENGMTWSEWCDSDYNTGGFYVEPDHNHIYGINSNGELIEIMSVIASDKIIYDEYYIQWVEEGENNRGEPK